MAFEEKKRQESVQDMVVASESSVVDIESGAFERVLQHVSARAALAVEWKDVRASIAMPQRTILDASSGSAEPGSLVALLGPSGSGKTTYGSLATHVLLHVFLRVFMCCLSATHEHSLLFGIAMYARACVCLCYVLQRSRGCADV